MDGCTLSMGASALACALASGMTDDELSSFVAFVTVLGDALELIAVQRSQNHCGNL